MQDKEALGRALDEKVAEIERFIANELGMGPVEDMEEAEREALREDVDDLIDAHEQAMADGDSIEEWTLRERMISQSALRRLLADRYEIEQKLLDALDEDAIEEGEDETSGDPNALQNAIAAQGDAFQRERDIRNRVDSVKEALQGLTDDQRKRVLNTALKDLGSTLAVRDSGT